MVVVVDSTCIIRFAAAAIAIFSLLLLRRFRMTITRHQKKKKKKPPLFSLSLARISLSRNLPFSVPGLTHHQTPHPTTEEELTQRQRCSTKDPKNVFVDFPCDKKSQTEKSYNDFSNTHSSK
jgi:hypothetical protein